MTQILNLSLLIFLLLGLVATISACCDRNAQEQAKTTSTVTTAPPPSESYTATLSEGIDFTKPGYPNFIARVNGISGYEPWGRWTDGEKVVFQLKESLPQKFTLLIQAIAFGPNLHETAKVNIGKTQQTFKITESDRPGQIHRLNFDLSTPDDTIELLIPKPTSPQELKIGDDPRNLGLGLIKLQIFP